MFVPKKILVIGDFMLDVYTIGEVSRVSPEAPVVILKVLEESRRPGGAGNVAINLVSLGMNVAILGRIGNDIAGGQLYEAVKEKGIDTRGFVQDLSYATPVKNRMISAGQQMLRVDYENPQTLNPTIEQEILKALPTLLEGIEVIAISDYAKGFLTISLIGHIMRLAKQANIPVIVDPKGIDFVRYRGASILKPNLTEAIAASGLGVGAPLDMVAKIIHEKVEIDTLMITRSKEGISLFSTTDRKDFPAEVHEVKDVTGAGDTVLAVISASVANHFPLDIGAKISNFAAGLAVKKIGCAHISLEDLAPFFPLLKKL